VTFFKSWTRIVSKRIASVANGQLVIKHWTAEPECWMNDIQYAIDESLTLIGTNGRHGCTILMRSAPCRWWTWKVHCQRDASQVQASFKIKNSQSIEKY
jgi:hypothetical protein